MYPTLFVRFLLIYCLYSIKIITLPINLIVLLKSLAKKIQLKYTFYDKLLWYFAIKNQTLLRLKKTTNNNCSNYAR